MQLHYWHLRAYFWSRREARNLSSDEYAEWITEHSIIEKHIVALGGDMELLQFRLLCDSETTLAEYTPQEFAGAYL